MRVQSRRSTCASPSRRRPRAGSRSPPRRPPASGPSAPASSGCRDGAPGPDLHRIAGFCLADALGVRRGRRNDGAGHEILVRGLAKRTMAPGAADPNRIAARPVRSPGSAEHRAADGQVPRPAAGSPARSRAHRSCIRGSVRVIRTRDSGLAVKPGDRGTAASSILADRRRMGDFHIELIKMVGPTASGLRALPPGDALAGIAERLPCYRPATAGTRLATGHPGRELMASHHRTALERMAAGTRSRP